jgi:hypothetical protein
LEKKRERNKKDAEWDARELFRIKDDPIFYILFHRNIPGMFADVVVVVVVVIVVAVVIIVVVVFAVVVIIVVVLKTVSGVFSFFFKLLVFPITSPDITRTKIIQTIICHIACLLRKCSHLE